MKLIKILVLLTAASALTACAASTGSNKPFLLDAPDSLAKECEGPQRLAPVKMSQSEVERRWGVDRARLVECRLRHKALSNYYKKRDKSLR
jgi:hypothetical protein